MDTDTQTRLLIAAAFLSSQGKEVLNHDPHDRGSMMNVALEAARELIQRDMEFSRGLQARGPIGQAIKDAQGTTLPVIENPPSDDGKD